MNWSSATDAELYTIACHDKYASLDQKWTALEEILKREKSKRKPYRNNQQIKRASMPRW